MRWTVWTRSRAVRMLGPRVLNLLGLRVVLVGMASDCIATRTTWWFMVYAVG